jgi:hypothetical protein
MYKDSEDRRAQSRKFTPWVGKKCAEIVRFEYSWQFSFPPAGSVTVASIWRLLDKTNVVLCSLDDGQRFGLPAAVDAAQNAWIHIFNKTVRDVSLSPVGDLRISFENDIVLEALINSSGYESWNAAVFDQGRDTNIVATGSGHLAIFERPSS